MYSKVRKLKHLQATWQFLRQGLSKEGNEYTWAIKTLRIFLGLVLCLSLCFFLCSCSPVLKTLINLYLLSRVFCFWNRNSLSLSLSLCLCHGTVLRLCNSLCLWTSQVQTSIQDTYYDGVSLPSSGSPNLFWGSSSSEYKIVLFAKFSSSLLPDCHAICRWVGSDIGSHLV
jgi:hypothetical protein